MTGGRLRVVAGSARGRLLVAPEGRTTRPTSDRVRESMFNALHSLGAVGGATVVDAFAGSGALGVEALSRGAASVLFIEPDRAARAAVASNLRAVEGEGRSEIRPSSAERVLGDAAAAGQTFDLVLLDPPYDYDGWDGLLTAVAAVADADGVVVIESDRAVEVGPLLVVTRQRRYGGTVVTFARRSGAEP